MHLLNPALADRDSTLDVENAYRRLGMQKGWRCLGLSPGTTRCRPQWTAEIEQSRKRWGSKLESLASSVWMTHRTLANMAEKQLAAITDVSAVPAIVEVLCMASESSAESGVKTLGQIREYQATRALAGQAVFSPWRSVRVKAVELLTQRMRWKSTFCRLADASFGRQSRTRRNVSSRAADNYRSFNLGWVSCAQFAAYLMIRESIGTMSGSMKRAIPSEWESAACFPITCRRGLGRKSALHIQGQPN